MKFNISLYKLSTYIMITLLAFASNNYSQSTNKKSFEKIDIHKFDSLVPKKNKSNIDTNPTIQINNATVKLLDTVVVYNLFDTSKNEYKYNSKGEILSELIYQRVSGNWVEQLLKETIYNDDEKITSYSTYVNDNLSWRITSKIETKYNSTGDTLIHLYDRYNDGEVSISDKKEYSYNSIGKVDSILHTHINRNGKIYYYSLKFLYDEKQQVTEAISKCLYDGKWINSSKQFYRYNNNGMILLFEYYNWMEDKWSCLNKKEYTYNESYFLIKYKATQNVGEDHERAKQFVYEYDENHNLIRKDGEQFANGEWKFWSKTTWTYDGEKLIKIIYDGYSELGMGHIIYQYFEEDYIYNSFDKVVSNNRMVKGENGNIYRYRKLYEYDNEGLLIKAKSEFENNGQWIEEFAVFEYEYNGNYFLFHGSILEYKYGITTDIENPKIMPSLFQLAQNYPNPFNPETTIKYSIPAIAVSDVAGKSEIGTGYIPTELTVYNVLGKKIETLVNENKRSGTYEVIFNAKNLPSGVYFYTVQAAEYRGTKKMILLK